MPSRDAPPWLVGRRRNGGGRRDKAVGSWVNFFKLRRGMGFSRKGCGAVCRMTLIRLSLWTGTFSRPREHGNQDDGGGNERA